MSRRGRVFLSGLALAILFLLPLLPEVTGTRRLVFRDAQITHWPWRRIAVASLSSGEVPFIDASASGGQPLLANPNAVLLYPTFLLEKVLPPAAAFNLHYLIHVLWAFAGARRLAARFGVSEGAAFFSGVVFAFSGAMLSYGSAFMNSAAAAAWLPWCAAAALDLARAQGARGTASRPPGRPPEANPRRKAAAGPPAAHVDPRQQAAPGPPALTSPAELRGDREIAAKRNRSPAEVREDREIPAERNRVARAALRAAAALGVGMGLQLLAGEPAISLLTGILILFLSVGDAWAARRGDRRRRFRVLVFGGAGAAVLAFLVAAPLLLPLREIFSLTYRGQHLYSQRAFGASPFFPWRVIEWLFPRFSGDPGTLGGGAAWLSSIHRGELVYLWSVTLGTLPVMVVLLAALRRDFWNRRSLAAGVGAAVTLLFAVGFALPFYGLLYQVDVLRRLRYPIKFYLLTTLCFAVLAGLAADSLRRRRAGAREAIALAVLLAVFAAGWLAAREGGPLERWAGPLLEEISTSSREFLGAFRNAVAGDALLGAAAALLLALLLFSRRRTPVAGYTLGFVTLLLAFRWGLPLFVSASEKELARPPALRAALEGAGRLYVSPALPRFEPEALSTRVAGEELPRVAKVARVLIEQLVPATGSQWGIQYIFNHDPDGSYGYYNRLAGEAVSASTPAERDRLLRLFGARWALAPEEEEHPLFRGVTGLAVAGRRLVLVENRRTLAEIRWAGRAHSRRSLSGALDLLRSDRFDERDIVIPGREDRDAAGAPSVASVRLETLHADRASVAVESQFAGHLIFSRTYFSAWKASLDGQDVPVRVANARELAVAVPPGRHRVVFRYDRFPFHLGVFLQVAGLLGVGVLAAVASPNRAARR